MSEENIISWSPDYNLKFSDFQKEEDFRLSDDKKRGYREGFCHVVYGITMNFKFSADKKKFSVSDIILKTEFDRKKSYFDKSIIKKQNLSKEKIDYLVLHEQGHFDLHEEIRPKLRKKLISICTGRLFETRGSTDEEIEDNAYEDAFKFFEPTFKEILQNEAKQIQDRYDEETNHSINEKRQTEYNQHFKQFRKIASRKKRD